MKKQTQNKNLLFSLLFILPDEELTKDKLLKQLTERFKHLADKKYSNLLLDAIMLYCYQNQISNDKPFSKVETVNFIKYLKEINALNTSDLYLLLKYLRFIGYISEEEETKELLNFDIEINEEEANKFIQSIIDLKERIKKRLIVIII